MADPRKTLAFDGVGAHYVTMEIDGTDITYDAAQPGGSAVVGRAVALVGSTSDGKVDLAGDGEAIYGKLISVHKDGYCTVQRCGFCALPGGNGATLTLNTKIVGALNAASAKGFIKTLPETVTGTYVQAEVQNAFLAAKTRGLIINNNDTAAVVVDLG